MKYRAGVYIGIVYTAAAAAWLFGRLLLGANLGPTSASALDALLLTQCLVAWVATPWFAAGGDHRTNVLAIALLVSVPWPLLVLILQFSDQSYIGVVAGQFAVVAIVAVCYFASRFLHRIADADGFQMGVLVLQTGPVLALWSLSDAWLGWVVG